MKIKLKELIESLEGLEIISVSKFKAKKLFEVAQFIKEATKNIDDFNEIKRQKIIQYGVEKVNDKGEKIMEVPKENLKEFFDEINDLYNKEIEIKLPIINIKDLMDIEMSPKALISLNYLLEKTEEEEEDGN